MKHLALAIAALTPGLSLNSTAGEAVTYPSGSVIEVSATYDAPIFSGFITQFFSGNNSVTLRSSSRMAIE